MSDKMDCDRGLKEFEGWVESAGGLQKTEMRPDLFEKIMRGIWENEDNKGDKEAMESDAWVAIRNTLLLLGYDKGVEYIDKIEDLDW